jgi:hypothetical protein
MRAENAVQVEAPKKKFQNAAHHRLALLSALR